MSDFFKPAVGMTLVVLSLVALFFSFLVSEFAILLFLLGDGSGRGVGWCAIGAGFFFFASFASLIYWCVARQLIANRDDNLTRLDEEVRDEA